MQRKSSQTSGGWGSWENAVTKLDLPIQDKNPKKILRKPTED